MNNNFGNLYNLNGKEIKLFIKNLDKYKFELFKDLILPVYKINSKACFLIKENSNASIDFKNLFDAFISSINRSDIDNIKRLSGVQGYTSYSTKEYIPKYYYSDSTFTYKDVKLCLINLLNFSLNHYNTEHNTSLTISDIY